MPTPSPENSHGSQAGTDKLCIKIDRSWCIAFVLGRSRQTLSSIMPLDRMQQAHSGAETGFRPVRSAESAGPFRLIDRPIPCRTRQYFSHHPNRRTPRRRTPSILILYPLPHVLVLEHILVGIDLGALHADVLSRLHKLFDVAQRTRRLDRIEQRPVRRLPESIRFETLGISQAPESQHIYMISKRAASSGQRSR